MDEERFNLSLRKLLKQFGITAQREVEKSVYAALESGALTGTEVLRAKATLAVEGLGADVTVEGPIELA